MISEYSKMKDTFDVYVFTEKNGEVICVQRVGSYDTRYDAEMAENLISLYENQYTTIVFI